MSDILPFPSAPRSATVATATTELIKDATTQSFMADVIETSKSVVVLVDFWAPWCGPCKQLTPHLEKAVTAANGRVRLVKMNIDAHPSIAGQMGIRSIPAVIAFKNGQPIDGFMGALPETQIAEFIQRVAGGDKGDNAADIDTLLEAADAALSEGDFDAAYDMYHAAHEEIPDHARAASGVVLTLIAQKKLQEAEVFVKGLSGDLVQKTEVKAAVTALQLACDAEKLGDAAPLIERLEKNPDDAQARFDYAVLLNSQGQRDEAAQQLLTLLKQHPTWNDKAAHHKLLEFFAAWGFDDPASVSGRRKLSHLLFS